MNNLENNTLIETENQYWVDLWESLERLQSNPDFKKLILQGYFHDKAVNGVSLLANDYIIREGKRSEVMENLIAISHLQDFFITVENLGHIQPEEQEEQEVE